MNDFEYSGMWWLPANEKKTIAGTLSFSNKDGIQLKLIGTFDQVFNGASKQIGFEDFSKFYPIIIGITHTGKRVTLQDCTASGVHGALFSGFESQIFSVQVAYFGIHNADYKDLRFHKVDIEFNHLNDWVRESGFKIKMTDNKSNKLEKYELEYTFPREIRAKVKSCNFNINPTFNTNGSFLKGFSLKEHQRIHIESKDSFSLQEWITNYLVNLQNLLTLATCRSNTIVNLLVYKKDHFIKLSTGELREIPIEVFFRTNTQENISNKELQLHDMLFSLKDFHFDFEKILRNWFRIGGNLKGVFDLYFSVEYSPEMYLPNQFLNLALAMEGFHRGATYKNERKIFKNEALPKTEYDQFKKKVLSVSPSGYEELLKMKLQYNEVSLKNRVGDLLQYTDRILHKLISNKMQFAKIIADTRNQLAHQNPSYRKSQVSDSQFFWMTRAMLYVLQACFFRNLGINISDCYKLFARNEKFKFAKHQIKQYF